VTEYYLADPSNPYQQSGRSSGAERWEETRRCLVKAIHRSGDFIDIGFRLFATSTPLSRLAAG
jgi:hypothetical protein